MADNVAVRVISENVKLVTIEVRKDDYGKDSGVWDDDELVPWEELGDGQEE